MTRTLAALLLGVVCAAAVAQTGSVDPRKLEALRKMSSQERSVLRHRLQLFKQLPAVEKARLNDNLSKLKAMPAEEVKKLREKVQKLTAEDQKEYTELAAGFFRWATRMGYADGFPRGAFFHWLKNDRAQEIEEIRAMEAGPGSPRVDKFVKLYHEFRAVMFDRTRNHLGKHRCSEPEVIEDLRDAAPTEFWKRWQGIQKACQARRAKPGPVPPLPPEKRK